MMTLTPEQLCDHAERLFKARNALWTEINAALTHLSNEEGAQKAMSLMVDQVEQWQQMRRHLEGNK